MAAATRAAFKALQLSEFDRQTGNDERLEYAVAAAVRRSEHSYGTGRVTVLANGGQDHTTRPDIDFTRSSSCCTLLSKKWRSARYWTELDVVSDE